jgi:hypothetical protein
VPAHEVSRFGVAAGAYLDRLGTWSAELVRMERRKAIESCDGVVSPIGLACPYSYTTTVRDGLRSMSNRLTGPRRARQS